MSPTRNRPLTTAIAALSILATAAGLHSAAYAGMAEGVPGEAAQAASANQPGIAGVHTVHSQNAPAGRQSTPQTLKTKHFILHWDPEETPKSTIGQAHGQAERVYSLLRDFLGPQRVPDGQFHLLFEGDAQQPDGSYQVPHVDGWGRVHLFRFDGRPSSYLSPLPHELVHVFRRQIRNTQAWDRFLEEAFASYVSDQVAPVNPGFPVYGRPLWLVAAQWFVHDEAIPLKTLRQRHSELNLPCKAQSYSLRGSFFAYLDQAYGKSSVMKLAYGGKPHSLALYREIFAKDLEALESEWKASLLKRFESQPDAQQQADDYRTKSPVAYFKICRPGSDF